MSGHSDLGIFSNFGASSILTWVQADTASAAFPAHPGNLDMMSLCATVRLCLGARGMSSKSALAVLAQGPCAREFFPIVFEVVARFMECQTEVLCAMLLYMLVNWCTENHQ